MLKTFRDPQFYQTAFLMLIVNIGILYFGLYLDYTKFFIIFLSTLSLDILFGYLRYGQWRFPFSGINAGFGISFFLRTDILILYFLAAFLAIGSKYLLQYKGKHFLNPSNFGVFAILVFFPIVSWTNPLQWTRGTPTDLELFFIYSLIFAFGALIVWIVRKSFKTNLLWIILPFLFVHFIAYLLVAPNETTASILRWYTPSFFIFVFFMLTEPIIAPKNNLSKLGFAINIAILPYILQFFINENYAHLAALFLMTLTLPVERFISAQNKNNASEKFFYFGLFAIFLLLCMYCIWQFGFADLVFENRCRQLFCY